MGAGAAPATLTFSPRPARAVAGQSVTLGISNAKRGSLCSLAVGYGKSGAQAGLTPKPAATNGRATWSWSIPDTVQANFANVVAKCDGAKKLQTKLLIVGALVPAKMEVVKDGFTVHTPQFGGADVSYGVLIKNTSPNADAQNVNVLVNFVLANDHLLGSQSTTIPLVAAGTTYALGNDFGFPGLAPIARLEVVIQVGGTARHTGHPPAVQNVVIEPTTDGKDTVGDVAGEVVNNDQSLTLTNTNFSAVLLDASGNVLGGGSGGSYGALPPGTRQVFKLTGQGFTAVAMSKAASVVISAIPSWQRPSSG